MKTLYIDCRMGAAGDMLTAALMELLSEAERAEFISTFNSMGIPGVVMEAEPSVKCGVSGTHIHIKVHGIEEGEHLYDHHHGHDHYEHHHDHHTHEHRGMAEIEAIINGLSAMSEKTKSDVRGVYSFIAEAESAAHGVPVSEVHFHEVGAMDAIADVSAVCMLMERIAPENVMASPVNAGGGTVRCAHGVLPVPVPATAYILEGIPWYSGDIKSELCTPTGAALLRHFVKDFGEMPSMTVLKKGCGMGTKDFDVPNCVTVYLGETV